MTSEADTGGFQADGLMPGRYLVQASLAGAGASTVVEVNLAEAPSLESVDLVLGRVGRVTGMVRNADTLEPVSGARVIPDLPGWRNLDARTDALGRFVLLDAPGRCLRPRGGGPGYMEGSVSLSAATGDRGPVTVDLAPRGLPCVVGSAGTVGRRRISPSCCVRRPDLSARGAPMRPAVTPSRICPRVFYQIAVGAPGGGWMWGEDFQIQSGGRVATRDFRLDEAASVSGRCLQSDGTTPLAGIGVALRRGGETVAQAETDPFGRYAFSSGNRGPAISCRPDPA